MNIKPLSDRVLIEPALTETKTASGIIIPDTAKEKPSKGTVVAVGQGNPYWKEGQVMSVKIGDEVLFSKHAGVEVKHEEKNYLLMREDDILAII